MADGIDYDNNFASLRILQTLHKHCAKAVKLKCNYIFKFWRSSCNEASGRCKNSIRVKLEVFMFMSVCVIGNKYNISFVSF